MTQASVTGIVRCSECGANKPAQAAECWLCGAQSAAASQDHVTAVVVADPENPYLAPQSMSAAELPWQFGLSSLFLIVTMICLCFGLWPIAPGLTVPLLVIAVPAMVRTLGASKRAASVGKPMAAGDKIGAFVTSLGIVVLVLVGGCGAFFMACTAGLGVLWTIDNRTTEVVVLAAASLTSLAFMVWLFLKTWPKAR